MGNLPVMSGNNMMWYNDLCRKKNIFGLVFLTEGLTNQKASGFAGGCLEGGYRARGLLDMEPVTGDLFQGSYPWGGPGG